MTIDDLIAEMPKDGWAISWGRLRKFAVTQDGEVTCCPITCGLRGLPPTPSHSPSIVARKLDISFSDMDVILDAADGWNLHWSEVASVRARLLAAVGLTEVAP